MGKEKSIKNMETIKPRMKLLILPKAIKTEKNVSRFLLHELPDRVLGRFFFLKYQSEIINTLSLDNIRNLLIEKLIDFHISNAPFDSVIMNLKNENNKGFD